MVEPPTPPKNDGVKVGMMTFHDPKMMGNIYNPFMFQSPPDGGNLGWNQKLWNPRMELFYMIRGMGLFFFGSKHRAQDPSNRDGRVFLNL